MKLEAVSPEYTEPITITEDDYDASLTNDDGDYEPDYNFSNNGRKRYRKQESKERACEV